MFKKGVLLLTCFLIFINFISSLPNDAENRIDFIYPSSTFNFNGSINTSSSFHNDLSGLQGGGVGEYYHIIQSWYDELNTNIFNWLTEADADLLYSDIIWGFNQSDLKYNFNQSDLKYNFNQSNLRFNFNQSQFSNLNVSTSLRVADDSVIVNRSSFYLKNQSVMSFKMLPVSVGTATIKTGGLTGTYCWVITSLDALEMETIRSTALSCGAISPPNGGCNLTWNPVNGSYGYKIYRDTCAVGTYVDKKLDISTISPSTNYYHDMGQPTTTGTPPTENLAGSVVVKEGLVSIGGDLRSFGMLNISGIIVNGTRMVLQTGVIKSLCINHSIATCTSNYGLDVFDDIKIGGGDISLGNINSASISILNGSGTFGTSANPGKFFLFYSYGNILNKFENTTGSYGFRIRNSTNDDLFIVDNKGNLTLGSAGTIKSKGTYNQLINGTTRDLYVESVLGTIGYISSSIDYKENIRDLNNSDSLRLINSLSPKVYDRKNGSRNEIGFIAEYTPVELRILTTNKTKLECETIKTYEPIISKDKDNNNIQVNQEINKTTCINKETDKLETFEYGSPQLMTRVISSIQALTEKNNDLQKQNDELKNALCEIKPELELCKK